MFKVWPFGKSNGLAFIYLPRMLSLVEKLKENAANLADFEKLGEFVRSIDFGKLSYKELVPAIEEENNYARNILMMQPIEAALLHWPPGVESAVHYHEGFYGYVVVLSGELDNIEYRLEGDTLKEVHTICGRPNGILPEKDGVIHKLVNNSADTPAVTLHIYYPPLEDFDGMKIYHLEEGKIGVLSATAKTASWTEPATSFSSIQENAFSYTKANRKASHRIFPILPKPDADTIYNMIAGYYNEQAKEYDFFDTTHKSRNAYTSSLNTIIANDYRQRNDLSCELALACGTGRRVIDIREEAGKDYHIVGVDLSKEMCDIARENGVEAYNQKWLKCELPEKEYDTASFLYAFGHICTKQERIEALKKVHEYLKTGGTFYFDVFNVNDTYEWGPKAVEAYNELQLDKMGYERGDVFYKKSGGREVAYLHYFEEDEIKTLLEQCGFAIEWVKHIGYTHNSGEELNNANSGALFIKAVKK